MPSDESLVLAQILLGLLLFTVGIPALIVEVRVEEPLRRLLHKRIRLKPIIRLGIFTLLVVAVLILLSGVDLGAFIEILLKIVVIFVVGQFARVWVYIYKNVSVDRVIDRLVRDITAKRKINDPELDELIRFGEHLKGGEKDRVIRVIGDLCGRVQNSSDYNGTQLKELLRGLQRVVVVNGMLAHHQSAYVVVEKCWQLLVPKKLVDDWDGRVLREVAGVLGSLAVSPLLGSMPQRWMSAIPYVVDVPYQVGMAAIVATEYRIAIEALSRISGTAEAKNTLPPQLIALVARFHAAGPSAGRTAREFLDKLDRTPAAIREATESASVEFTRNCDYATADAIGTFLETYQ